VYCEGSADGFKDAATSGAQHLGTPDPAEMKAFFESVLNRRDGNRCTWTVPHSACVWRQARAYNHPIHATNPFVSARFRDLSRSGNSCRACR
jgi:hypothetical protein